MQASNSFNSKTVDWRKVGVRVDATEIPHFDINAADVASFQHDGVVLLRGAFSEWVDSLRAGLDRNLQNPLKYAFPCESNPAGEPGRFFDSYCNWQLIPEYLDYVSRSSAASLAGQIMSGDSARFFHDHAFVKTPGTQRATPWHQDLPYYCVDGLQTASIYVSLDRVDAEVAVQFVKGSHRWNRLFYPRVFENGSDFNVDQPGSGMESVPDVDAQRSDYEIAVWSLEPGDTIVFDFRTLHGTGDAVVKRNRRAFSTRWLGDDVTYCERLRDDWFPLLWRRGQ